MECQVRSMTESSSCSEPNIPQGKVESVCREWLVREDSVLAYKLQSEEIETHYGHNKEMSQIVRSDLREARNIQRSEKEEAELMQQAYEQMLLEQENADAMIAKQIQDKLLQEELEKQRQIEEEDKLIALELQKKEKLRIQRKREERELRQVEKVKAEQQQTCSSFPQPLPNYSPSTSSVEAAECPLEQDFSDLCLQPPNNLPFREQRKFREDQDAELAKFLQDQEMKRRHDNDIQDQRFAIEAQDRELAKVLQEQERARARRAKERAKLKAMQQQDNDSFHDTDSAYKISPIEDHQPSQTEIKMKDNECYGYIDHYKSPLPGFQPVHNIAMVLDPTYSHRKPQEFSNLTQGTMTQSPLNTQQHMPIESQVCSSRGLDDEFFMNVEDVVAPPYMPIQGQRRPQTLEKQKKTKKHKEGCKTQ